MKLPGPLVKGTLVRRYKRFLSDITLETGETITAHVANPGSLMGLSEPGTRVWVSRSNDPRRKLAHSWELVDLGGGALSGVSTAHPNRIVEEALRARAIPALADYGGVRREVAYGEASRVDFLLTEPGLRDAYVEVKNVHLRREDDWAEFPDSVTARGAKHLRELATMAKAGARAVMLYCVQRTDCARFKVAGDIDAAYLSAYRLARAAGVEAYAHVCAIAVSPVGDADIRLGAALPVADPD